MRDQLHLSRTLFGLLLGVAMGAQECFAQCAMCRASIANSDDPVQASSAVNAGILVLLMPTLALITALVALVLRYHREDSHK